MCCIMYIVGMGLSIHRGGCICMGPSYREHGYYCSKWIAVWLLYSMGHYNAPEFTVVCVCGMRLPLS